uniref:PupL-truncated n=1 Tax=Papaver somniferum TaxID=3469 RepID=A0A5B7LK33_PAPSO|nr:PupL-truncated [Papaver somniferum]
MIIETLDILGPNQNGNSGNHTQRPIKTRNWLLINY